MCVPIFYRIPSLAVRSVVRKWFFFSMTFDFCSHRHGFMSYSVIRAIVCNYSEVKQAPQDNHPPYYYCTFLSDGQRYSFITSLSNFQKQDPFQKVLSLQQTKPNCQPNYLQILFFLNNLSNAELMDLPYFIAISQLHCIASYLYTVEIGR